MTESCQLLDSPACLRQQVLVEPGSSGGPESPVGDGSRSWTASSGGGKHRPLLSHMQNDRNLKAPCGHCLVDFFRRNHFTVWTTSMNQISFQLHCIFLHLFDFLLLQNVLE